MGTVKTFCTFAEYQKLTPKQRGEFLAKMISTFVNSAGEEEKRAFADTVLCDHRTLQQELFDLFLRLCEKWAELDDGDRQFFDLRNEFTVKRSKQIVELLEGCMRAPYI